MFMSNQSTAYICTHSDIIYWLYIHALPTNITLTLDSKKRHRCVEKATHVIVHTSPWWEETGEALPQQESCILDGMHADFWNDCAETVCYRTSQGANFLSTAKKTGLIQLLSLMRVWVWIDLYVLLLLLCICCIPSFRCYNADCLEILQTNHTSPIPC